MFLSFNVPVLQDKPVSAPYIHDICCFNRKSEVYSYNSSSLLLGINNFKFLPFVMLSLVLLLQIEVPGIPSDIGMYGNNKNSLDPVSRIF